MTYKDRIPAKHGRVSLAEMDLRLKNKAPILTLVFEDGQFDLGEGFIYDAFEHYLNHLITKSLREFKNAPKKWKKSKSNQ